MKPDLLAAGIDVVADVLIPPVGAWPAPSALQVGADLVARLREREATVIAGALASLGAADEFAALPASDRIERIAALERDDPAVFEVLRRSVYYAYYAQPAVIRQLRAEGHDINEAPQPQGYRMEPFSAARVDGVDTRRLVWISADQVGSTLKTAS